MCPGSTTRVLLVDDHPVFRRRLRLWVETWEGFEVLGEAEDGERAVDLARLLAPDLVIMDVQMPRVDGLAACPRIKRDCPATRVVLFSAFANEISLSHAVGADAFLPKDRLFDELRDAVRRVLPGS